MESIQSSYSNLLKECQNTTSHSQPLLKQKYPIRQLNTKISESKMLSKISPQEQQYNNAIIQKMRKRYHKKQKESSIKKTDLGEDLLTFTKEQMQKLQFIDQCQQKNIIYRQTIEPFDQQNNEKMSAIDRLKKMAKVDDIIDQIKNNLNWGDIKQNQQKKYYLRIKQAKGFMKRSNKNLNTTFFKKQSKENRDSKIISDKYSQQQFYRTLLNKNSFNKNFMNSMTIEIKQHQNHLTFNEKIEMIKEQASKNLIKVCSNRSLYMTEQRKNALYQCQILRLSKKMLGPKQYQKLHFSLCEKQCEIQQQEMNGDKSIENESKNCEAEQILQKNHKRINEQRKRVIQKLLC